MIQIVRTDTPGYAVVVACDSCGQLITDAPMAVVFRGPDGAAMFAHKGRCHDDAERRLSTAGKGFLELRTGLEQLVVNCGMKSRRPRG